MKIIYIQLDLLKPYEFNNRIHSDEQIGRIAKSLEEFGFTQPIVINDNNSIIAGHGRFLAARKLGLNTFPCIRIKTLTEAQIKAYRILDNKLASESEWDMPNLIHELETLTSADFDLPNWGLNDLFPKDKSDLEEDASPEKPTQEIYIKRGDLIQLNDHKVLCGDSTNIGDINLLLGGGAPLLMVTDPPYGVEYDPAWREGVDLGFGERSKGKVANDNRFDWQEVFERWPCEILYCWHAGRFASQVQQSIEAAGYNIISQIIWAKQHFALSRGDYHWQHEPCWYAAKSNHNWQGARDQATLWEIKNNNSFGNSNAEETFGHGTQKPLECMARPIRNNSQVNDLVCDPFLGSGTTLIAAHSLDRICYGMEIEPAYCQMIIERFKKFCSNNNIEATIIINGVKQKEAHA